MAITQQTRPPLADTLLTQIRTFQNVTVTRADCGIGRAISIGGHQVLHLHTGIQFAFVGHLR